MDRGIMNHVLPKAMANGWKPFGDARITSPATVIAVLEAIADKGDVTVRNPWSTIIFDHNFAKALWGEKFGKHGYLDAEGVERMHKWESNWQHHLQQMVIADDPIQYLKENT